jgi:hypothetical protein
MGNVAPLRLSGLTKTMRVLANDISVGRLGFDRRTNDWVVEVRQHIRRCKTFDAALEFIESVVDPEGSLAIVRSLQN